MPRRCEVISLEGLALGRVGELVAMVATRAAHWAGSRPGSVGGQASHEVTSCVESLGHLLLATTPHCFHPSIAEATLTSLSALLCPPAKRRSLSRDVDSFVGLSQEERRRCMQEDQALLAFPALLCRPNLTSLQLGGLNLEPVLVRALATHLPDMPNLKYLDLGSASCRFEPATTPDPPYPQTAKPAISPRPPRRFPADVPASPSSPGRH